MRTDFFGKKPARPQDEWLAQRMAEQSVVRKVAKVAAGLPKDEAILFFVFKPQQMSQDNYRRVLEAKLSEAGVDLHGTVPVLEYDYDGHPTLVQKPRICILTYGQETSLNDYAYAQNVFLVGILHREELDVLGQYVATCDGGDHELITTKTAQQLVQSEIVHTIYQALSRGCCRITENGQARPMKAWIIHYAKSIRQDLEVVMPGVKWVNDWKEPETEQRSQKPLDPLAEKLREHLYGLPSETFPKLIRQVKDELDMVGLSRKVWRRISAQALEGSSFDVDPRLQAFVVSPTNVVGCVSS
jgi:hypothetical protein